MTRSKRYEGEKRRADHWHSRMRDKAWDKISNSRKELQDIFPNYMLSGYVIRCDPRFNAANVCYDIVTYVSRGQDKGYLVSCNGLPFFEHWEDMRDFPSDHLKTKLLLIAG